MPHTPEKRLLGGKQDHGFRTKPQIALARVAQAQAAGIAFSAIVADCFYGDDRAWEKALLKRRLPHVLARRGAAGRGWALVSSRAHAVWLWAGGQGGARCVRHDRSARTAFTVHLVPDHEFVARAGAVKQHRATVRLAQLGQAKLQTDKR